jgi:BirA family transcriptional regulator, biotin operon repressor / biotin---[acetyl-CoA-carboxylase] ligase
MPARAGAVHIKGRLRMVSPDLSADEIVSRVGGDFWRKILFYESVDSTNDVAAGLITKNADTESGTLVIADAQEKGKGRCGRKWLSPPGLNVYMSIILKPEIPLRQSALLTLLAAVSSARALRRVTGADVSIKWPNDLVICGRKLGGILTEVKSAGDKVHHAVIGLGINVNIGKDLPGAIRTTATSLRAETRSLWSRTEIIAAILDEFEYRYKLLIQKGADPLTGEWRRLSSTLGKEVLIVTERGQMNGRAEDIDVDGTLLLRLPSGKIRRISAGDLTMLR